MGDSNSAPDRYGVMGHPIDHSWSPFIHGLFAKQTGQNLSYRLFDVPPEKFRSSALEFFSRGGRGLNITVPHKPAAAELVNRLTPRAEQAAAVNTIMMDDASELLGDNTDGAGLLTDLTVNLGIELASRSILILGAGGATRGVLAPLLEAGPSALVIANRTSRRAIELAAEFSELGPVSACAFDELQATAFDLVINATAASLQGEVPLVPARIIDKHTVCYDMSYGKGDTSFTRWAREHSAGRALKGWGMLVEQAAESFHLWRGVRPDTGPILEALAVP